MKAAEGLETASWVVETEKECKRSVGSAGGKLYGYNSPVPAPVHWASAMVNVNIKGRPTAGLP